MPLLRFLNTLFLLLILILSPAYAAPPQDATQDSLAHKHKELKEALELAKEKGLDLSVEILDQLQQEGSDFSKQLGTELKGQMGQIQQFLQQLPTPRMTEEGDLVIPKFRQKQSPSFGENNSSKSIDL